MSNGSRKKNVHPHSQQPGKSKKKYERGDGQYNPDHPGASPASKMVGPMEESRQRVRAGRATPEEIGGMLRRESKRSDTARRKAAFGKKAKASKGTVSHRKQQRDFGQGGMTVDQIRDSKKADKGRAARKEYSKEALILAGTSLAGGAAGAALRGGAKALSVANKARKAASTAKKVNTARKTAKTSQKVASAAQKAREATRLKKVAKGQKIGDQTGKDLHDLREMLRAESLGTKVTTRAGQRARTILEKKPGTKVGKYTRPTGKAEAGTGKKPSWWDKIQETPNKSVSRARKTVADKAAAKASVGRAAADGAIEGAKIGAAGAATHTVLKNTDNPIKDSVNKIRAKKKKKKK